MEFERLNPMTRQTASKAQAMTAADAGSIAERAATVRILVDARAERPPRRAHEGGGRARSPQRCLRAGHDGRDRRHRRLALFNLMLAASMTREAAAITTQIGGEVIPSDKPGCLAMALREPVGVVLGIAPWNAPIILGCEPSPCPWPAETP